MSNIGELFVRLRADTSDFENGMNQAQATTNTFKAVISQNLNQIGQQMAETGKQILSSIGSIVSTASEWSAQVQQQKFVYDNLDGTVQKAISNNKNMAESLGMTEQQYMNNSTATADFLSRTGMTSQAIADQSGKLTTLTADMAAFADIPVDEAASDFRSALMGNFEVMDKYGVSLSVATIEQGSYAKEIGKSWNNMTQAEKAQATLSAMIEQGASITGLAEQEAGGFTMQMQQMKQRLMEAAAAIGEKLFPVLEPLISKVIDIAKGVADWTNEHPKLTQAILMVVGVIGGLMAVGGPLLMIFASLSTISLAVGVAMLPLVGIIAGVVAAIVAAVAIGVALWQNWDTIKTKAGEIWNAITSTIGNAVNTAKSVVISIWNNIKSTTISIWNGIKSVSSSVWNGIKSTISNVVNTIKSTVSNVFNSVKSTISNIFNSIKSTATSIWNGIKNAIMNPINTAKSAVSRAMSAIKSAVNVLLKPKLKLPHISVSGSFSLNPPSVPKIGVEWYAKGGIMTSPTMFGMNGNRAMIGGEAGPEAILPLDRIQTYFDRAYQKNNQTIDYEKLTKSFIKALKKVDNSVYMNGELVGIQTASTVQKRNEFENTKNKRLRGELDYV